MALKESEAIVLRTYPLRESDLLVTLFTRLEGKVKGVARAAMKSRRRFGGALEPLTYVRAFYDDRERQELARLDSCEVIESPMASEVSYPRATALAHVAELLDELMPDREASDAVFRLSLAVLQELRGQTLWMPLTYFELWMTRLMGLLPDIAHCIACGEALHPPGLATTITFAAGPGSDLVVTDGPYAEAKEVLGGFYLIEAADLDEAIKWAAQIPAAWRGKVELRPVFPMSGPAAGQ